MINKKESLLIENILLEATTSAAIQAYPTIGEKNPNKSDKMATDALRNILNESEEIHSKILIGEGERDNAPMLFIGEELGNKNAKIKIDIAVDPIEGTNLCANNQSNSISIICAGEKGSIMNAPDLYMDKISTGVNMKNEKIDLDYSIHDNLKILLENLQIQKKQLNVVVLDRPRHYDIIEQIKTFGSNVILISDNDIVAIMKSMEHKIRDTHLYIGTGGAPEGVISAAIANNYNGFFQGRLNIQNSTNDQIDRAKQMGIIDFEKKYTANELVKKESILVATGITNGDILKGITIDQSTTFASSIVMNQFLNKISIIKNKFYK